MNYLGQKSLRIDLGSGTIKDGESSPEGYLRQDIDPSIENLDIVCDIADLEKHLSFGSCQKIRASHVLEHFPTKQIPKIFKTIYDLLESGGNFEIIVPNFAWHAELVIEGKDEEAIHYAFGGQLDEWDFHKTGFTPKILRKRLRGAGFSVIHLVGGSSIEAIGEKP